MTETATMDPPAAAVPPPASTTPLADLILARLLTEKRSMGEKKLRADLAVFFRRPPADDRYRSARDGLRDDGLVTVTPRGGLSLTDAGRQRALAYLGTTVIPQRANWGTVKANYLVPKALGTTADALRGERLAAVLLKRKLGLPVGTRPTMAAVLDAIVCRELGFADQVSLSDVLPAVLGKAVGSPTPLARKDAKRVLPRVLLDAKQGGLNGLRDVALAGLGDDAEPAARTHPPAEAFDLEAFANTVKSVARTSPTGRFGDNKVFISHVWRQLADHPQVGPIGPDGFKRKLVEAHRADRLTLSRADLVQVMDPADVRASETAYLNATFHFVLVEKE